MWAFFNVDYRTLPTFHSISLWLLSSYWALNMNPKNKLPLFPFVVKKFLQSLCRWNWETEREGEVGILEQFRSGQPKVMSLPIHNSASNWTNLMETLANPKWCLFQNNFKSQLCERVSLSACSTKTTIPTGRTRLRNGKTCECYEYIRAISF